MVGRGCCAGNGVMGWRGGGAVVVLGEGGGGGCRAELVGDTTLCGCEQ